MSLQIFHSEFIPLKNKLYRFACRIMGNKLDAEDVVQELYLKVWGKRSEWKNWKNKEAMCMTMVKNLCLDKKRSKHNKIHSMPEHFDQVDDAKTPDQKAADADSMGRVKKLISELPELQQMVVQLRDIEGYSYKEIAEILDISMGQVKVNLHRARLQLKEKILKIHRHGIA